MTKYHVFIILELDDKPVCKAYFKMQLTLQKSTYNDCSSNLKTAGRN